ncbi:hypothetical protein OTU49_006210, partial [Cherax quadricarinatus]
PPPKPKKCLPITKIVTEGKLVDVLVPIYKTDVKLIVVPTTVYDTIYDTQYNVITKLLYTTLYDNYIEYDSSVAVGTRYVSVTDVQPVPAVTTVTNIKLQVVPSVVTNIKGVTVGSAKVLTDTAYFTKTITKQSVYTATQKVPFPIITTQYKVVTETKIVADTVTVTAPLKKAPPVISTIENTEVHYNPVILTTTLFTTIYATVVKQQPVPFTVVTSVCSGGEVPAVASDVSPLAVRSNLDVGAAGIGGEIGGAGIGIGTGEVGIGGIGIGAGIGAGTGLGVGGTDIKEIPLFSSQGAVSGNSYASYDN